MNVRGYAAIPIPGVDIRCHGLQPSVPSNKVKITKLETQLRLGVYANASLPRLVAELVLQSAARSTVTRTSKKYGQLRGRLRPRCVGGVRRGSRRSRGAAERVDALAEEAERVDALAEAERVDALAEAANSL